ncbi:MAG: polyprenyl synthetase family protein [Candidatus Saccharimonadales bacterium]
MAGQQSALYVQTVGSVEAFLQARIEQRVHEAKVVHARYEKLWKHIQDAVMLGGKRFRPYLVMVGYGGFSERLVPIAAAQELMHAAMLIHDDIIDGDTMRRGHKNIQGTYTEQYAPALPMDRAVGYAKSAALLGGDALVSEAFACIAAAEFNTVTKNLLTRRMHQSVFEVIGGELMDIEAGFMNDDTYDPLTMYRYKTAGYSFIGPLLSGAVCAGLADSEMKLLTELGEQAGTAFQLQDDLFGIFGEATEHGKSVLLDLREGKRTYVIAVHAKLAHAKHRTRMAKSFGNIHASNEDLRALRHDIEESGARAETERMIEHCYEQCLQSVSFLRGDLQRAELSTFIQSLKKRTK